MWMLLLGQLVSLSVTLLRKECLLKQKSHPIDADNAAESMGGEPSAVGEAGSAFSDGASSAIADGVCDALSEGAAEAGGTILGGIAEFIGGIFDGV
jgi:hypothetical protein